MPRKAGGGSKLVITGLKEVDRLLAGLEPKLAKKHIRGGMRKGMKLVRDAAKANAPVRTGKLKKAIKVRAGKARKRKQIVIEVRVGEGDFKGATFYGAFQEFGTKRLEAREYMDNAFQSRGEAARQAIIAAIKAGVESAGKG